MQTNTPYLPPSYCSGSSRRFRNGSVLLSVFIGILIRELKAAKRRSSAKACQSILNSLTAFTGNENLPLEEITPAFICSYQEYLRKESLNRNSISSYMRSLRAILNKAVDRKLIPAPCENPFAHVYTGIYKTKKRALDPDEIRRLSELAEEADLSQALHSTLQYFLFAFHACGMSFIDLAFLRKCDISDDHILYCRKKTGCMIPVKITRPMREILDYFSPAVVGSPYAFPIINPKKPDEYRQYETALRSQNRRLKKVCEMAGIEKNVSTHVSRHSWATVAKREYISIAVISDCLGHQDEKTTAIYMDSFNTNVTDMASERVSAVATGTKISEKNCFSILEEGYVIDYHTYKRKKIPSKKCPLLYRKRT
ncbi:MAG: site-specific integrase [Dysgonamonadaceae bacterium]|jgi:integrase|nr:site-specific integrase [Dysgonamonadaceae bacterium]